MDGFDMGPNMARQVDNAAALSEPAAANNNGLKVVSAFSPWKHPKRFRTGGRDDTIYELYSVCNHHGSDLQVYLIHLTELYLIILGF